MGGNNNCGPDDGRAQACTSKALIVLRLVLGFLFIMAGYNKLFGPEGITSFTTMLTDLGFPAAAFFAWLVALIEFVGGIAIILGIYTRVFATLLAIIMVVAFAKVHPTLPEGNMAIALFGISLALALAGPGKWALVKGKCRPCNKEDKGGDTPAPAAV